MNTIAGKVLMWNKRGFGLIQANDGEQFFVHYTAIAGTEKRKDLEKGQSVEFQKGRHHEGKLHANAVNVKVVTT